MYRCCICFTLLLAVSYGFRVEQFAAQISDYNVFFDEVLGSIRNGFPNYFKCPPLNLDVGENGTLNAPVARFSSPNCLFGDFRTLARSSPVIPHLDFGNLTLGTTGSFGALWMNYANSTIELLEQNFVGDVDVAVNKNEFDIHLTVYSQKNGSCAVELKKPLFTTLSKISVQFLPLGFFNRLNLRADLDNLIKTVLDKFNYIIDIESISRSLEDAICSQVMD